MNTANAVLGVTLAVLCLLSAVADFRLIPQVVQTVERLRLPTRIIPTLGIAKTAAGAGLLLGLAIDRLGIFAALCLSAYFVIAVAAHVRVRDAVVETMPAIVMMMLSMATFLTAL